MAKTRTITVNENIKCRQCGKGGAVKTDLSDEYGLCLSCAGKNIKSAGNKTGNKIMIKIPIRYEEAPDNLYELMNRIIAKYEMTYIDGARILIILDTKMKMSNKKLSLGFMKRTNDMLRFLTIDAEEGEALLSGYDYIMRLDKFAVHLASAEQLEKLMRHELRHCHFDPDKKKNPWQIRPHDIEDFSEEIELNKDDPAWGKDLAHKVSAAYAREKDPQRVLFD